MNDEQKKQQDLSEDVRKIGAQLQKTFGEKDDANTPKPAPQDEDDE